MFPFSSLDVTRAYGLDFLFPAGDRIIGAALRTFGEFARPEVDALVAVLASQPGGAFVDVGANIGSIALPVAAKQSGSTIICIEANRRLAQILAANALANRLANVEVIHAAAGSQAGLADFPVPSLDSGLNFGEIGFASAPEIPRENVRVCTLDEVAPPGKTRLVKLDVEGFELEVLAGGERTFTEDRPAWLFETKHNDDRSRQMIQRFLDGGYRLFWLYAPFVTNQPLKAVGQHKPNNLSGDTNVLALPADVPLPFDMTQIRSAEENRPGDVAGYPYLRSYGFSG